MSFPRIRYMHWAKRRLDIAPPEVSLASSAVESAGLEDLGLVGPDGRPTETLPITGLNVDGHPRIKAAIAERHGVAPERVLVEGGGTSLVNFLLFASLLEPGDVALCEWPCYEPLWRAVAATGARVEWLARREEERFAIDVGAVAGALARGARLVVLTDLQNPGGVTIPEEVVRELGRLALRNEAHVLIDEVYLDGAFEAARRRPPAAALGERLVSTASLTKVYGLGQLRCGWAIAPPAVVERAWDVNDYLGVEPAYIADELALRAFARLDALAARARARRAETWPIVQAFLESRRDLAFSAPDGGFTVWVRLPPGVSSDALDRVLFERYAAQVTPGSFFGFDDHVRIGYGPRPEVVREGLARFGRALDDVRRAQAAAR